MPALLVTLCVFWLPFMRIILTASILSLWLYKDSGSRNTIYASLASYIMRVLAPIHAHNINSLAFSLSLPLWLYKDSGSRNTIYASLASYIMRVLAPIHAHNINSLAFSLSLSLSMAL